MKSGALHVSAGNGTNRFACTSHSRAVGRSSTGKAGKVRGCPSRPGRRLRPQHPTQVVVREAPIGIEPIPQSGELAEARIDLGEVLRVARVHLAPVRPT